MPCGMNLEIALEPVRVILKKGDSEDVTKTDTIHLDVKMLPILVGKMGNLLKEQAKAAGWVEQPDGSMTTQIEDATVTLSPDATSLTISRTVQEKAVVEIESLVRGEESEDAAQTQLDQDVVKQLEAEKLRLQEKLDRENLAKLVAVEPAVRGLLNSLLNKTYREALETRAREMGELESIVENGSPEGSYEVRIVVKA